jgi:hypothetical protein
MITDKVFKYGAKTSFGKKIIQKLTPGSKTATGTLIGANLLGSSVGVGGALIGGTLGLLGGALGLAGGVLKAGSTIAGIAADASTGVMSAAGGMQGGGQSGNVENTRELQSIGNTMNKSGRGSGLSNMKSSFGALAGGGGGAMSLLPTGEESETTLLGQILGQIRTNTTLLSSMLGVLTAGTVQSNINNAKRDRVEDEKKPSLAKRTFTALGGKLKKLSGSLAGGAGTLLKGVGIGVLFLLFKKYRSQITDMVGKIFETLDGWYTALKDGNNPIDTMFANVKSFFNESVLPTLKDMTISFLQMFYDTIRTVLNAILPESLQLPDMNFAEKIASAGKPPSFDTTADNQYAMYTAQVGGNPNELGTVGATIRPFDDALSFSGSAKNNLGIQQMVTSRLEEMYKWFDSTGGRVQWTNIGEGFELGGGIDSLDSGIVGKLMIADIMTSMPIVDGFDRTIDDLSNPSLLATPFDGMNNSEFKTEFFKNLTRASDVKQNSKLSSLRSYNFSGRDNIFESFGAVRGNATGRELVSLEAERRAIVAAATAFANAGTTLISAAGDNTNIKSTSEFNMASNVINTDQNMVYYYLGDRVQ